MDDVRPFPQRGPRRPGGNGPGGGRRRSSGPSRRWPKIAIAIAIPVVILLSSVVNLWVEFLWFAELGQREVLATRIQWAFVMGLGAGVSAFIFAAVNFLFATRVAKNDVYMPFLEEGDSLVLENAPEQLSIPHFVMRPIVVGIAVVFGIIAGLTMAGRWEVVLRYLGRSDFGVSDPQFNRDAAFYIFNLPLYELLIGFLQTLVVITAIATALVYVAMGVIRYAPVVRVARPAISHLMVLAGIFVLLQALSYRVRAWNLVTSESGYVTGVGWTDAHARLPAYLVVAALALGVAVLLFVLARSGKWRIGAMAVGAWIAVTVVGAGLVPGVVQRYIVKPNQDVREKSLIESNIKFTRNGYGLGAVEDTRVKQFGTELDQADLATNKTTTENIRLWSPDVLQRALEQLQEIRTYYSFSDVDVDRYELNGRYTQIMLSAREIRPANLSSTKPLTWVQEHLQYTHGFGVAAAYVNRVTPEKEPDLLLKDIPPVASTDLKIEQPRIYYGEEPDQYVVGNTKVGELDYPGDEKNITSNYDGSGGIEMKSAMKRLALAARFRDINILLSDAVGSKSRFMFRRNIKSRVSELAPFLDWDNDPYITVLGGRLVWILDGYTTSDRYPFSQFDNDDPLTQTRINYLRNPVKATVDAYTGETTMYVVDEDDPIINAWRDIFPSLFTDKSKMSDELVAHLRYPEGMFEKQSELWSRYHMDDADTFYKDEDLWDVPTIEGAPLPAFYVLARLPGEDKEEMLLIRPMLVKGKPNINGYVAARMDREHYGQIVSYELPKGVRVPGPAQVQGKIETESEIAEKLTLYRNQGSTPILGNLIALPIADTLLYVQPIFLESPKAQIPELERIVVVLGDTVAWGTSVDSALTSLLEKRASSGAESDKTAADDAADAADDTGEDPADTPPASDDVDAILAELRDRYAKAEECAANGDWECYGKEQDAIEELLG